VFTNNLESFERIKKALILASIIQSPDQTLSLELLCDANNFDVGAILRQRRDKKSFVIYYVSKTLDEALMNYLMMEKEMLAMVCY